MTLRYLYHSGFAIEAEGFTIVIDYYNDECEGPRGAGNGVVDADTLSRPGAFYVLSSHAHPDHYVPKILEWKQQRPDINYIFSFDIRDNGPEQGVVYLNKGDFFNDGTIGIKAYGSTDEGISFLIKAGGKEIFHAGDLNNWHWNEICPPDESGIYEQNFLKELDMLQQDQKTLDLAMFPVDWRLGKDYSRGAEQFMDTIDVNIFSPMHFENNYKSIAKFQGLAKTKCKQYVLWNRRGETIEF